jgi:zinc transporter ZupT
MNFHLYILLILFGTLIGGLLPLAVIESRRYLSLAVSFAAGVLIGTALFHLLPESIELIGKSTGLSILTGFAVFYLPQKFMLTHPCEEGDCDFHKLGLLAFIGIGFHAIIDGLAVGAAHDLPNINVIAGAVMAHKIPAALALALLLMAAEFDKRRIAVFVLLFSLATPAGALSTKLFVSGAEPDWLGHLLGFSAGNFLAIAGSDLLRRLHDHDQKNRFVRLALLVAGCSLSLLNTH